MNVSRLINRWRSAFRYLKRAAPIYKWRVRRSVCPNCNGTLFLSMRSDAFMTRCLSCLANVTNLSLIPVIKAHQRTHQILQAWEMSTYGATLNYLKANIPHVYESEYFEGARPGELIDGILNQNVENLSFEDSSLDLITSNQVFEHVHDDLKGFSECYRVLRSGGALIFSIPLYDTAASEKLATVRNGKLEFLSAPEYHDSRRGGPNSALCFWRHSFNDIVQRVSSVGFSTSLVEIRFPPQLSESTFVIYAHKN